MSCEYVYSYIHIYICTHEDRSKSSKPHPEKRNITKDFYCGNTLPLLTKPEKRIQICSNPCAGEALTKVFDE